MGIRQTFTRTGGVLVSKLTQELAASLSIEGCAFLASGDVAVDFLSAPTAQDLIDAQAIIDAHDETDYVQQVQDSGRTDLQALPGWSTWTAAQAVAWINANVVADPSVITALENMAKSIIYLRNDRWPDLQE